LEFPVKTLILSCMIVQLPFKLKRDSWLKCPESKRKIAGTGIP